MRTDHKQVPGFPKVLAKVAEDGTATVTINGVEHPITGDGPSDTRSAVIGFIAGTAERLGRPVRVRTVDAMGEWHLIVYQDGLVESDTSVEPPKAKSKKTPAKSRSNKPKRSVIRWFGGAAKSVSSTGEDEGTPQPRPPASARTVPVPSEPAPRMEGRPAPTKIPEDASSRGEDRAAPATTGRQGERPLREADRVIRTPSAVAAPGPGRGNGESDGDVLPPKSGLGPVGTAGDVPPEGRGEVEGPPVSRFARRQSVPENPPPGRLGPGSGHGVSVQEGTTPPSPADVTVPEERGPGTGGRPSSTSSGNIPSPSAKEPAGTPTGHPNEEKPEPMLRPTEAADAWKAAIQENNQRHDPTGAHAAITLVASPVSVTGPSRRGESKVSVFRRLVPGGSGSNDVGEAEFSSRIQAMIPTHRRIAVLSLKGGVGKTTTAVLLGSVLASERESRVIAVDANPDRGTLRDRLVLQSDLTLRDLADSAASIDRYTQLRQYVSVNESRLHVLTGSDTPTSPIGAEADGYKAVAGLLEQYYDIALTDCGTGLNLPGMESVLSLTDQVIIVLEPALDAARSAHSTLSWLSQNGYRHLADKAIVVVSRVDRKSAGDKEIAELEAQFGDRAGGVVRVPFDEHLAKGGIVRLEKLRERTRSSYRKLALLSVEGLARLG